MPPSATAAGSPSTTAAAGVPSAMDAEAKPPSTTGGGGGGCGRRSPGTTPTVTVLPIALSQPGPLGMTVISTGTKASPGISVRVKAVTAGSQSDVAGVRPGDVITYPGSGGTVTVPYDFFMSLCGGPARPVVFDVRRTASSSPSAAATKKPPPPAAVGADNSSASSGMDKSGDGPSGNGSNCCGSKLGATSEPSASGGKRPFLADLTNSSSVATEQAAVIPSKGGAASSAPTGASSSPAPGSVVLPAPPANPKDVPSSSSNDGSPTPTSNGADANSDEEDPEYLRLLAKIEGATAAAAAAGGTGATTAASSTKSSSSDGTKPPASCSGSGSPIEGSAAWCALHRGETAAAAAPAAAAKSGPAWPPPPRKDTKKPQAKKKKSKPKQAAETTIYEDAPSPGFVCRDAVYYSTLNNETPSQVAAKLGCEWRSLVSLKENTERYGKLGASTKFLAGTLLRIPRGQCSKWKLKGLVDTKRLEEEKLAKCERCGGVEREDDAVGNPMLMCDGCDATCHLRCADGNLKSVPDTDWFCSGCADILRARRAKHGAAAAAATTGGKATSSATTTTPSGSLRASLPPLPPLGLDDVTSAKHADLHRRLTAELRKRRDVVSVEMAESNRIVRAALRDRIPKLERQVEAARVRKDRAEDAEADARRWALRRNGLIDFGGENKHEYSRNTWIECRLSNGRTRKFYESSEVELKRKGWYGAITGVKPSENWRILSERRSDVLSDPDYRRTMNESRRDQAAWERCREELSEARSELRHSDATEDDRRRAFELEYAALLGELPEAEKGGQVGKKKKNSTSDFPPRLLGRVRLADEGDVNAMSMLLEPQELVVFLPYETIQPTSSGGSGEHSLNRLFVGGTYAVFARNALFDRERDDTIPIDGNGQRDAQRALMRLLSADGSNAVTVVSRAKVPPSVRIRGEEGKGKANNSGMFDLSELVRDCNADLDLALELTPPQMKENGLELRMYQQASLRWMLDKEMDETGMGFAGELWDRMRFLSDGGNAVYYYSELTGTFCLDIFDFREDVGQNNAALDFGGFQTGGILGEEMGLGKTIICLSLIVSNPPPKEDQVLKREHIWSLEKHSVDHPDYLAPPSVVGAITTSPNVSLSNGTLVIVPMTLISQWQSEIERFAPWLTVMTLHTADNPKPQEIASADVVVMSTSLLQGTYSSAKQAGKGKPQNSSRHLLGAVRKIHWHRILIDEAHYNNVGQKTKEVLASLSATHRHCVTGTPIGNTLDDLYGQLRFLRLPQFCRWDFWQNNISNPYYSHNNEALRVLRSLLSRVVIRHSKEQSLQGGESLVSLPPRSVETELIPFGTKEEQELYSSIEKRNRESFERLRQESIATLSKKTMELQFMLLCARQACSHASMIDLEKLDRMNQKTDPKYIADMEAAKSDNNIGGHKATRASILASAAAKARPSAQSRVRSVILKFQDGGSQLMECPVCLETVGEVNVAVTPCGHPFCSECILSVLDAASSSREAQGNCPTCRTRFGRSELTFLGEAADAGERKMDEDEASGDEQAGPIVADVNGFQITASEVKVAVKGGSTFRVGCNMQSLAASRENRREDAARLPTLSPKFLAEYDACSARIGSKVAFLLQEIDQMNRNDPSAKAVVFSQFVPLLDVASQELTARGIRFVRIYGSDKQHQRADALLDFSSDPGIKIFLLSMRAGAVGLNLTAANNILILDAPQNSALEEQAIDRVHRIGQTRPVVVKRFVAKGTVEERIIHVRRDLSNDKPMTGTQVCDASLMTSDNSTSNRPAKRARREEPEVEGTSQDYDRQQERLENMATLFNTTLVPSVFKA